MLQGLAYQHQAGGGEILLAGLCLPLGLIPHRGEPAPEIHLIAQVEGGAQVAAGAAVLDVLVAARPQAGVDRRGEVGVGEIGTEQGALEPEPRHLHVRVGREHLIDQLVEGGIPEPLPPEPGLLAAKIPGVLLPRWRHVQLGSVVGALLAAGTEAGGENQAKRRF